jgi:hypothetical protein
LEAGRQSSRTGSIDERPEVLNNCQRFGDWEVDTVISKKGCNPDRDGKKNGIPTHEKVETAKKCKGAS